MTDRHIPGVQWQPTRVSEWMFAALAIITLSMGMVVLLAGEDEYVGLGGDVSWRVGDLSPWWGYGLLAAGTACLVACMALIRRDRAHAAAGETSVRNGTTDLLIHTGVFVLVNGLLWAQDIALGDGLNYAYWATIPWAVGLAFQAYGTVADRREVRAGTG
jgi:hypothetical protein